MAGHLAWKLAGMQQLRREDQELKVQIRRATCRTLHR